MTSDDIICCASEVGALYIEPSKIIAKGRLKPGRMLLVDTKEGRIVDDKELKMTTAKKRNFQSWIDNQLLKMPSILRKVQRTVDVRMKIDKTPLSTDPVLRAFGYTVEQLSLLMLPMIADGKEVRLFSSRPFLFSLIADSHLDLGRLTGARLDGQRCAARVHGDLRSSHLRLLPPALRAGHQPSDRPDPRVDGHVA